MSHWKIVSKWRLVGLWCLWALSSSDFSHHFFILFFFFIITISKSFTWPLPIWCWWIVAKQKWVVTRMANTIMTITATDGLLSLKSKKEILTTRMILTVWLAKFENTQWRKVKNYEDDGMVSWVWKHTLEKRNSDDEDDGMVSWVWKHTLEKSQKEIPTTRMTVWLAE